MVRTILRRIGIGAVVALVLTIGLWIAALRFLPSAPGGFVPFFHPASPTPSEADGILTVPVAGVARTAIRDSWGDPRDNGLRAHHGTDIMAAANTPVLAAAPGTVEKLWTSAAGGTTLYVRSPDRTWTYYYAHLASYAPGLREGQVVRAGDPLAYVGDTGNAGPGNFHLHFGLTRMRPEQRWFEGEDVDPYPYLAGKALPQ